MFTSEFYGNKILQWALGALIFNYFIVFHWWIKLDVISISTIPKISYVCPPYWQSCESLYFLESLPSGYSQSFFYMLLFAGLVWAVYLMSEQRWREVQLILIVYFAWHTFCILFFTERLAGNYEYYLLGYGLILLFLPHKEFFLKLFIVFFYTLSTITKIHPAWIEGGYFHHLRLGLPIFPEWSITLMSNVIIVMEMVVAWFLLSKPGFVQKTTFVFFVLFHLYSITFVEYRYPATVLPMLVVLFGPWYRQSSVPLDKRSIAAWAFIALLLLMQLSPKFIYGDEKLTLEGNRYGLYMFESNHQCISEATAFYINGDSESETAVSVSARRRCNAYYFWFRYHELCEQNPDIHKISWTFDHSINGDPFLRIVDEPNVCDLEYKPFSHNEWIKTHADNPEVIGWPVENIFN